MNMESQNNWMLLRLTLLARWCVPLALLSATTSPGSLVLTRDTGITLGVHARRAQTLQCVHPQCR